MTARHCCDGDTAAVDTVESSSSVTPIWDWLRGFYLYQEGSTATVASTPLHEQDNMGRISPARRRRYGTRQGQSWLRSFALSRLFVLLVNNKNKIATAERAYPAGCSHQPTSYYDYHKNTFPPADLQLKTVDDYLIVQRLGTGKFSDVFEAVDVAVQEQLRNSNNNNNNNNNSNNDTVAVDPRTIVVLKCLKPVSERKVRREILILQHASRLPNLARLQALVLPTSGNAVNMARGVPTLVLQHAGPDCRWLSHYGGGSSGSMAFHSNNPQTTSTLLVKSNAQGGKQKYNVALAGDDDDDDDDDDTTLSDYEIRYYVFHLLVALDALHQKGIMHRDVKPRNCLIRRLGHAAAANHHQVYNAAATLLSREKTNNAKSAPQSASSSSSRGPPLMLIDLGLADFYLPNQKYNVRVASRHYKSPELLVGFGFYDYALDLWGVGCILASLLCFREPFFRGKDNLDQLGKIIMQLGTTDLLSYILKYQIQVDPEVQKLIQSYHATGQYLNRKPWKLDETTTTSTKEGATRREPDPKGLDLLDRLLVYDHEKRWNARQAMEHSFFDVVRRRVLTEVRSYAGPDVSLPSLTSCSSITIPSSLVNP